MMEGTAVALFNTKDVCIDFINVSCKRFFGSLCMN